ncbi:PIN domain-containing protein [Chloroflexota bacterium]
MFDLKGLQKTVEKVKAPCVIILDTEVLMDAPKIKEWKIRNKNVVFVIPKVVISQLIKLKTNPHTTRKAKQALDQIVDFSDEAGNSDKVVHYEGIGSFILILPPAEEDFKTELGKHHIDRRNIGKIDMGLIFLTKECNETIKKVPTMLSTADKDCLLTAFGKMPIYRFDPQKPWETLPVKIKEMTQPVLSIDWSKEIDEIYKRTAQVQLTLSSAKNIKIPASDSQNIIDDMEIKEATGSGFLIYWGDKYSFNWSLQYQPYNIISLLHPRESVPTIRFDADTKHIPGGVTNRLQSELERYASLKMPRTLQGPKSIILNSMYFYYLHTRFTKEADSLVEVYEKYEVFADDQTRISLRRDFAQYLIERERKRVCVEREGLIYYPNDKWIGAFPECLDEYVTDTIVDMMDWAVDSHLRLIELVSSLLFDHWEVGNSVEFDFPVSD